MKHRALGLI